VTKSHFYAIGVYLNKNNLTVVKDNWIAEKYVKYLFK